MKALACVGFPRSRGTAGKMPAVNSVHRDGNGKQYLNVMKAMWDLVDKHFDLPYVMHFLAMLCSLVNGAKTPWFANSASPLFLMVLNINYTQTRKSSLTDNGDEFGDCLDDIPRMSLQRRSQKLQKPQLQKPRLETNTSQVAPLSAAAGDRGGGGARRRGAARRVFGARPEIISSVLHSATPTEFFHRCAGDFQQVQNAEKFPGADLHGRHTTFGVLVNLDESYDFITAFGLLHEGKNQNKSKTSVNPHQSAFNKLAQCGHASRATKTAGSFG